jgi:hypothetical protein
VSDAASLRFRAITRALEGVGAFNDRASNPDGYCACMGDAKCFLHGVTIPEGITAAESLLAEFKGASDSAASTELAVRRLLTQFALCAYLWLPGAKP